MTFKEKRNYAFFYTTDNKPWGQFLKVLLDIVSKKTN